MTKIDSITKQVVSIHETLLNNQEVLYKEIIQSRNFLLQLSLGAERLYRSRLNADKSNLSDAKLQKLYSNYYSNFGEIQSLSQDWVIKTFNILRGTLGTRLIQICTLSSKLSNRLVLLNEDLVHDPSPQNQAKAVTILRYWKRELNSHIEELTILGSSQKNFDMKLFGLFSLPLEDKIQQFHEIESNLLPLLKPSPKLEEKIKELDKVYDEQNNELLELANKSTKSSLKDIVIDTTMKGAGATATAGLSMTLSPTPIGSSTVVGSILAGLTYFAVTLPRRLKQEVERERKQNKEDKNRQLELEEKQQKIRAELTQTVSNINTIQEISAFNFSMKPVIKDTEYNLDKLKLSFDRIYQILESTISVLDILEERLLKSEKDYVHLSEILHEDVLNNWITLEQVSHNLDNAKYSYIEENRG